MFEYIREWLSHTQCLMFNSFYSDDRKARVCPVEMLIKSSEKYFSRRLYCSNFCTRWQKLKTGKKTEREKRDGDLDLICSY